MSRLHGPGWWFGLGRVVLRIRLEPRAQPRTVVGEELGEERRCPSKASSTTGSRAAWPAASGPVVAPSRGSPAARSGSRSAGWPPTWPSSRCCSRVLGPSALLFFEKPTAPESSPYRAVVGHLVGILAGVAAIAVFGLLGAPSVLEAGVSLGLLGEPRQLAWVLLLTAASWALNRLAGVPVRLREG